MTEEERLAAEAADKETWEEEDESWESDEGSDDGDDWQPSAEEIKAENERLKVELAATKNAKNKANYKAHAKSKTKTTNDTPDVSELVAKEFEKINFFNANPDADKEAIMAVVTEKWLSLEDASILVEGKKMKDDGYRRTQEAGKRKVAGTFWKGWTGTPSPFAKWPKLYTSNK